MKAKIGRTQEQTNLKMPPPWFLALKGVCVMKYISLWPKSSNGHPWHCNCGHEIPVPTFLSAKINNKKDFLGEKLIQGLEQKMYKVNPVHLVWREQNSSQSPIGSYHKDSLAWHNERGQFELQSKQYMYCSPSNMFKFRVHNDIEKKFMGLLWRMVN